MFRVESLILTYLANSLWQVPLLLGAGWLAARLARRLGAATEYAVWLSVVVLQTVLPALTFFSWQQIGLREWQWLRRLMVSGGANHSAGAHVTIEMGAGSTLNGPHLSSLLWVLVAAYLVVTAWFAVRFFVSWLRIAKVSREAVPVALPDGTAHVWETCSRELAVQHASLMVSPEVYGPVAVGVREPKVLLPVDMIADMHAPELCAALAHECAHLRRNDYLVNLFLQALALPVSYHPLAALARTRLAETREMVCDEMAAGIAGPKDYARSLLRLAALLLEGAPLHIPHAIGLFDANALERRLMKLTGKQREIRGAQRLAAVLTCAVFGTGVCGTALALGMHVNASTSASAAQSDDAAPTKAPKKVAVSSGVMAANRVDGPQPKYPDVAKKAKIQGTVVLEATIGKDGKVENLKVVSGSPMLQSSAIAAVKDWTYKPFLLNGDPVEVETQINVIYTLGDAPPSEDGSTPPPPPPPSSN